METYDDIPRMNQMYFGSCGVTDEYLHLDLPRVGRRSDNSFVLYCEKAVQETVYDHFRVFHHGKIFLTFTPDLKVFTFWAKLVIYIYFHSPGSGLDVIVFGFRKLVLIVTCFFYGR